MSQLCLSNIALAKCKFVSWDHHELGGRLDALGYLHETEPRLRRLISWCTTYHEVEAIEEQEINKLREASKVVAGDICKSVTELNREEDIENNKINMSPADSYVFRLAHRVYKWYPEMSGDTNKDLAAIHAWLVGAEICVRICIKHLNTDEVAEECFRRGRAGLEPTNSDNDDIGNIRRLD